jgi:anaerobic selenocysteine-containing dehydrogenase
VLLIHPNDAAARGIVDGMTLEARNQRGVCYFNARVSPNVPTGVVRAHSTRWNKSSVSRLGINQLTSERLTDIGGGPTFYSCLVEVLPVTEPIAQPGTNSEVLS